LKVIKQLARHFWSMGALSVEQANSLVRQGFVRAEELEGYQTGGPKAGNARRGAACEEAALAREDSLHAVAESLIRKTTEARRGGGRPGRDVRTLGLICDDLRAEFGRRAGALSTLVDLARPLGPCPGWEEAAILLRNAPDAAFHPALCARLRSRPGALRDLWRALDAGPFHALARKPELRGPSAHAFRVLLRTRDPGGLGKYAWVLKAAEVAAVGNLLQAQRRLLTSLRSLYRARDRALTDAMRDGLTPELHWAFVLLYNAGLGATTLHEFGPAGECRFEDRPAGGTWYGATACALLIDPGALSSLLKMSDEQTPLVRPWAWRVAGEG
jgi:hypothetical protein